MKRVWKFAGGIAALLGAVGIAYATQTCQRSDFLCYESGPSQNLSTPFRVDSSGNVSVAGSEAVTGNQTTTGNTSTTGSATQLGPTIYTPVAQTGISTITTISPTGTYMQLLSTGTLGPVLLQAASVFGVIYPVISTATATNGQYVILSSTSSTSGVIISTGIWNTLDTGLRGSAGRLTVDNVKRPAFIFDSADSLWHEVHD